MSYYIIVFKNTLDAMTGEKKLNEYNYRFRMMPTPTTITQSCGICIRIEEESILNEVLDSKIISFKSVYRRDAQGYTLVRE